MQFSFAIQNNSLIFAKNNIKTIAYEIILA